MEHSTFMVTKTMLPLVVFNESMFIHFPNKTSDGTRSQNLFFPFLFFSILHSHRSEGPREGWVVSPVGGRRPTPSMTLFLMWSGMQSLDVLLFLLQRGLTFISDPV
jgi:hypothetical protein